MDLWVARDAQPPPPSLDRIAFAPFKKGIGGPSHLLRCPPPDHPMATARDPEIRVDCVGIEREPVVTVDGFAGDPDMLRQAAALADFGPIGQYYPGDRAPVPPLYVRAIGGALRQVLVEFFDYRNGAEILRSYYSLATMAPHKLSLPQRIPHTDAYDDHQVAVVHFLNHDDLGGTAFFRHRSTGFETVNAQRVERYHSALSSDFGRIGEPEPAYVGANSPLFERTHVCAHRFNRAVIYRGKLLHCADLANTPGLPDSVEHGRLTVATFIRPRAGSGQGRAS